MTKFQNYVCLDLETTGLDPQICDVTEFAAIKVRDGEIVDRLETFVFTPLEISQHISYLTGITAADLEGAPDFVDLIEQIQDFIGDDPLVGHNIWFDWNFLTQKGVKLENNPLWDTYVMSTILYPQLPSHSLETNTKYFGIPHEDSHRAMADVIASHELWKILIDTFPSITPEQKEQISSLQQRSQWPLFDFFLADRTAHQHPLDVSELSLYHPQELEKKTVTNRGEGLFIHCPGHDPVDIAHSLQTKGKTLYIAGYPHTQAKIQQVFPDAYHLYPPYEYLSESRRQTLLAKEELEEAEATLLLKTILNPDAHTKEELVLSHPERAVWRQVQTTEEELEAADNAYQQAYQQSLQADKVIVGHRQVMYDLEYLQHFDQLVVLEPQLLEANATRSFGRTMNIDQWVEQSEDEDWQKKGDFLFAGLDQLGNSLIPSSQYAEHVLLTDYVTQSNEFIRMRSSIVDLVAETTDEKRLSFLKYYQVFFQSQDPSWVRWITVDPRRGVSITVAPLDISPLLVKHLFSHATPIIISETSASFRFLPNWETLDIPRDQGIQTSLPPLEEVSGNGREGDHQALISYLAAELPKTKGKVGVVFSSKSALKRYFFDLAKVVPDDKLFLAEDVSGGTGKLRDRYLSGKQEDKIVFLSYRNMRSFPPEVFDFDTIYLQSIPFDPPGYPIHQARSETCNNAFMDYALPNTLQNLLEITSNFSQREGERQLILLDRRIQEKRYGEDILRAVG